MNKSDLKRALEAEQIRPDAYCLTGGLPSEQFTIDTTSDGRWCVYYSERGRMTSYKSFATESEVFQYLLQWVLKYPSLKTTKSQ